MRTEGGGVLSVLSWCPGLPTILVWMPVALVFSPTLLPAFCDVAGAGDAVCRCAGGCGVS